MIIPKNFANDLIVRERQLVDEHILLVQCQGTTDSGEANGDEVICSMVLNAGSLIRSAKNDG